MKKFIILLPILALVVSTYNLGIISENYSQLTYSILLAINHDDYDNLVNICRMYGVGSHNSRLFANKITSYLSII